MSATHVEVESKFDVDAAFVLPDLLELDGVSTVQRPVEQLLEATYFDTPDLRLLNAKITLRRRTGGEDAGWHLKLPASAKGARLEVHKPLGRTTKTVPAELARLVRVRVRSGAVVPVATLRTRRVVHRLLGPDGTVLGELADDTVSATTLATAPGEATHAMSWREIEVELVGGDESLLAAADAVLRKAGAKVASSASKVGRVLESRRATGEVAVSAASLTTAALIKSAGLEPENTTAGPRAKKGKKTELTAGQVARAHLASLVEDLQAWDPHVRVDTHDAVHKMRVATRKLRSALATDRALLDRTVTDPLRGELKWLGAELGAARDAEVLRARLHEQAQALPPELLVGPVLARIDSELAARYRTAHDDVLMELDGARYLALVEALERLAAEPPFTQEAGLPARKEIPRVVRRTLRRVQRAVAEVEAAPEPDAVPALAGSERDVLLHEVRKAAKRARYAAEAVAWLVGEPAQTFAESMEGLQEILGRHQDSVVARGELRAMGMRADDAQENAFTYGLLFGIELAHAESDEQDFATAWKSARTHAWP